MPVIPASPEGIEGWMSAPAEQALRLQRPLPDGRLEVVATVEKRGSPPAEAAG